MARLRLAALARWRPRLVLEVRFIAAKWNAELARATGAAANAGYGGGQSC
jgi:hypothetical protein